MKKSILLVLTIGSLGFVSASAEDGHDHANHKEKEEHGKHKEKEGHDHGKEHSDHDNIDKHKGHDDHDDKKKDGHAGHDDHDDHGGGKAVGKGKAITAVDKVKGFKLSKEAIKTLGLKLQTVDGSTFSVSKKTLVTSKNKKGVYRFRGGFFKLLEAKILREEKSGYKVEVSGVDFGDQIVVNGTGLLRVTDVYSTDKSSYGHSH
jgi:hypothetical protein